MHFFKNLSDFLQESDQSVFIFTGSLYPHTFLMDLFDRIEKIVAVDIQSLDIQSSGDVSYKANLETTFLGMQCVYWLGDLSALKAKQKDGFLDYIMHYQGPHKILLFLDGKFEIPNKKNIIGIAFKDKYFLEDAKNVFITQDLQQAQNNALFLQQMYKIKPSYSLDELFLVKNYQNLITTDSKEFYTSWITRLVTPESSLFTLSQLFFEKKEQHFLNMWLQVKSLYADMFWISFWSDQIYRAYFFITFTQEENFAAAKQVSFGLSFSFLKQTYKQYELQELRNVHQALFVVDTALKNGGTMYQIDQVLLEFLAGKFK